MIIWWFYSLDIALTIVSSDFVLWWLKATGILCPRPGAMLRHNHWKYMPFCYHW